MVKNYNLLQIKITRSLVTTCENEADFQSCRSGSDSNGTRLVPSVQTSSLPLFFPQVFILGNPAKSTNVGKRSTISTRFRAEWPLSVIPGTFTMRGVFREYYKVHSP